VTDTRADHIDSNGLQNWLRERVAAYGDVSADDVDTDARLTDLGLDSVYALTLCGDIEDTFNVDMDPAVIWDHDTIRSLADALAAMFATQPSSSEPR
jgi:acyl carrier protein